MDGDLMRLAVLFVRAAVKPVLKEVIAEQFSGITFDGRTEQTASTATEWIDTGAVEKEFGISRSSLYRYRQDGLPAYKVGNKLRYRRSEIEDYLMSRAA